MKLKYLYGLMSLAVLFPSCNQEEFTNDTIDYDINNVIKLGSVQLDDFENNTLSRATYEGYATKFEYNDKLGLILIDKDGTQLANAPFTYSAAGWTNDNTTYYSSKIDKIIAYFPYNTNLPKDVVTLDAVKQTIEIATDQSNLDKFKQTDLLACEIEDPSPELTLQLKHVFSLVEFSATQQLEVEGETFNYNIAMSNVSFSVGETMYTPCNLNGGYVCMIKDNSSLQKDDFRYFYTIEGKSYVKTLTTDKTITSGTKYTFPCPAAGMGESNTLSVGDFYCTSTNNKVVILPSIAATIPEELTCKGIVFYIMNNDNSEWNTFVTNNQLTEANLPGYNGKHGLVVSLTNGNNYGAPTDNVNAWGTCFTDYEESGNKNLSNGYKMTKLLTTNANNNGVTFGGLDSHKSETIANATSWYIPSFNELKYLVRGENSETSSSEGLESINNQLGKINGEELSGSIPSITFITGQGFCLMQRDGQENGWHGIPGSEKIRPICAF